MWDIIKISKKEIYAVLGLVALGLAYLLFVRCTNLAIPCFFRAVTGYKCPGCGITTMAVHLSKLELKEAARANYFLFVSIPVLALELFCKRIKVGHKLFSCMVWGHVILFVAWGFVRNIMGM